MAWRGGSARAGGRGDQGGSRGRARRRCPSATSPASAPISTSAACRWSRCRRRCCQSTPHGGKTGVDFRRARTTPAPTTCAAVISDTTTLRRCRPRSWRRLRRGPEDRAAGRGFALGAGGSRLARPAALDVSSSPAPATSARSSPPTSATAAPPSTSSLGHTVGTRSRRPAPTSDARRGGRARSAGRAAAVRCGRAARGGDGRARPQDLPLRLDPEVDVEPSSTRFSGTRRHRRGVGFVLLARAGGARTGQLSTPLGSAARGRADRMTTARNRVAVLHGVNFDILDRRETEVYGGSR